MESRIVRIGFEVLGCVVMVDELVVEGGEGKKTGKEGCDAEYKCPPLPYRV